jgi:hypothetical protein
MTARKVRGYREQVISEAFDAEAAAARVAGEMLPLADATRAAQEKRYLYTSRAER